MAFYSLSKKHTLWYDTFLSRTLKNITERGVLLVLENQGLEEHLYQRCDGQSQE